MNTPQNPDRPAHPVAGTNLDGLTKRELIAAMPLQGLLASYEHKEAAVAAVAYADALLAELAADKTQEVAA